MKYLLWLAVILVALFLSYWAFLFICSCFVNTKKLYDKHSSFYRWLLVSSTWHLIFVGRVHFHTRGMEKIPLNRRFLLVCNHRSKLDPITTWYLPIDRENPRNAMKTIEMAADLMKNDQVSIAVYPEGTRNFGEGLLPFHNGIFKIAQKANVPVVICGIKGADQMPKNFPLHGTDIYFEVLDVLTEEQVRTTRCNDIGDYARDLMLSFVERNQEEEQNVNLRTV